MEMDRPDHHHRAMSQQSVQIGRLMFLVIHLLSISTLHALPLDQQQPSLDQQLSLPVTAVSTSGSPARPEGIEFPNTAFIPGDLTEQLSVDGFFSLWFVFLDDDVFTSDKEFTILAPKNEAPTRPSPTADDKDRVRQLLLNHIVLGRAVNISSDLSSLGNNEKKKPLTLTTIGGRQLHFKNRQGDGSAVVNGVKIIGKEVGVLPNGVIIVLDDYLFMDEYHGDVEGSESQLFPAIPMVTSSDTSESFPMIELGTHDHSDGSHGIETVKQEHIGAVLADRQKIMLGNNATDRPFYEELIEVLNFLRSGTSDFRRYLEQVNISKLFTDDGEYTAFIPMDDSFAQWYPIDWGFNPFDVEDFVKETMMNHFVRGRYKQKDIKDGAVLTTLGGKTLTFSVPSKTDNKMTVNGVEIFDGDTVVSHGNIQFIGDLLFVNSTVVRELNAKHRDVESAPLVSSPWYSSQFLSHTYRELSGRQPAQYNLALDYVNRSELQLRDDLPSHTDNWKMITYTFFVPRDSAFLNLLPQDTADPFVIDDQFRRDVFLNHFVRERLYHDRDLIDGAVINMAGNETARITRENNVTKINDAVILESDIFIYNLGTVFVIDRVLFVSQERIGQVLAKNADRIPSFGLIEPGGATSDVSIKPDATTAIDMLDSATTESTAGKLVIRE